MKETYSIYTLTDPRDQSVRYVGMTKQPHIRHRQHLTAPDSTEKGQWVKELLLIGMLPIFSVIEIVQGKEDAEEREAFWIRYHSATGKCLTNTHYSSRSSVPKRNISQLVRDIANKNGWSVDTAYNRLLHGEAWK